MCEKNSILSDHKIMKSRSGMIQSHTQDPMAAIINQACRRHRMQEDWNKKEIQKCSNLLVHGLWFLYFQAIDRESLERNKDINQRQLMMLSSSHHGSWVLFNVVRRLDSKGTVMRMKNRGTSFFCSPIRDSST